MIGLIAFVVLLPLVVLSACLPKDTATNEAICDTPGICSQFTSFSALGDSYAAGYGSEVRLELCNKTEGSGSPFCTSKQCKKDTGAYSYQFAQNYSIPSFQYLSCSGANVSDILDTQVDVPAFGKPDLITLNAGGDDNGTFANVITKCVYERFLKCECDQAIQDATPVLAALPGRLDALFGNISANAAPNATVVVLGYPRIWGNLSTCPSRERKPTAEQKQAINGLVTQANAVLNSSAVNAGFLYGDIDSAYEGHRVCDSGAPWFQLKLKCGHDTDDKPYCEPSVFHPTIEGQDAYFSVLKAVLGC